MIRYAKDYDGPRLRYEQLSTEAQDKAVAEAIERERHVFLIHKSVVIRIIERGIHHWISTKSSGCYKLALFRRMQGDRGLTEKVICGNSLRFTPDGELLLFVRATR